MHITVENGKIIFCKDGNVHSFEAHGEIPRPSIMPTISVGGRHLSDRSEEVRIEKHTAIQDIVIGNEMAAWYTQEFLPDGVDYKLSKNAAIYLGDFTSGEEIEILFKHSGIKKSCIGLHITPKRIFFQHWTHSENHTMWYDRETKEIINPHFDGSRMSFIDDETIIYHGLNHTWCYDVATMKKKRFFSNKEEKR